MANNITLSYPSAFHHQFLDLNGKPLTGGKLYTYIAGSTTPVVTYKTISGGTESANRNTNPIILDMAGMAELVIATDTAYKFVLFDKNDAKIAEWDNVTGNIGGGGGSSEDIVVVGTPNEIDVSGSVIQGVKRYVVSLSNSVKITILQLIGLYNNVLNSLGNKADKVQGATAGNLAALDASGNLTDSGSKVADFKTKQTPVADPSASGAGLEFIDSVSQNANGEITPHKKAVQDGTTAQKGVVKLSNAIDSTSVTEAATPKAVKDAYDALNNKIVARAVFLSQAEWAVQSQLQGDPAKVYYVENGTGEDAYTVYVWKESTSTYEEVDESSIDLDGYWHDSPTTTGSGNVVTNITLGNDGVPQVEKGMSAEPAFSVLPISKGGTGGTTKRSAAYNIFSDMQNINVGIGDTSEWVQGIKDSSATSGPFCRNKILKVWEYIQNKISSVLGLTASSYGGNADTATTATNYASGGDIDTALAGKLGTSGDGSNVTATFTKASGDTSTMASGGKLSAIFTAISSFFASLKALAFKDKASYNDLSSGVQSSLDKADSALQSHQSVTDNNPTLAWGATSKVGKVGSTDLRVTMPSNPAQNLPASVITSGTFGTDRIADDAITAAKVKDNETLPVNISGRSQYVRPFVINKGGQTTNVWAKVATASVSAWNGYAITLAAGYDGYSNASSYAGEISVGYQTGNGGAYANRQFYVYRRKYTSTSTFDARLVRIGDVLELWVKDGITATSLYLTPIYFKGFSVNYADSDDRTKQLTDAAFATYIANKTYYEPLIRTIVFIDGITQTGSPTTPVYVDPDGQVQPCTQGSTLKSNTATLYIAGYTDNNIPYYHVKDIKNGCVNHVDFSGITNSTCDITFEAPTLSTGEEYDYIISLEGYTNNNGYSTGPSVENCKQVLYYDSVNNLWRGEPLFLQATDWRQICVVRGNTCEWKRVALS